MNTKVLYICLLALCIITVNGDFSTIAELICQDAKASARNNLLHFCATNCSSCIEQSYNVAWCKTAEITLATNTLTIGGQVLGDFVASACWPAHPFGFKDLEGQIYYNPENRNLPYTMKCLDDTQWGQCDFGGWVIYLLLILMLVILGIMLILIILVCKWLIRSGKQRNVKSSKKTETNSGYTESYKKRESYALTKNEPVFLNSGYVKKENRSSSSSSDIMVTLEKTNTARNLTAKVDDKKPLITSLQKSQTMTGVDVFLDEDAKKDELSSNEEEMMPLKSRAISSTIALTGYDPLPEISSTNHFEVPDISELEMVQTIEHPISELSMVETMKKPSIEIDDLDMLETIEKPYTIEIDTNLSELDNIELELGILANKEEEKYKRGSNLPDSFGSDSES